MASVKTCIDARVAEDFLIRRFCDRASRLERIEGGEQAEVFFFEVEAESYVLRVDSRSRAFAKDMHARRCFASRRVPIPEIIALGRFDERHSFAISRKAPGTRQDRLSRVERIRALPSVFETLDALHASDISRTTGYGYWNGSGNAARRSFAGHVYSARRYGRWREQLLARPVVDRDFVRRLWEALPPLVRYVPSDRRLVHGDFGHNNLLIEDGRVTSVLDWGEAAYGDFMFDVSWLNVWDSEIDYGRAAREHYTSTGRDIDHYDERLRLYELSIAAGSLAFFAFHHPQSVYLQNERRFKHMFGF